MRDRWKWDWIEHSLGKPATSIIRHVLFWNPQGKRKRGKAQNSWRRNTGAELKRQSSSWEKAGRTSQSRVWRRSIVYGVCSSWGATGLNPIEMEDHYRKWQDRRWCICTVIWVFIAVGLAIALAVTMAMAKMKAANGGTIDFSESDDPTPFADLTVKEIKAALDMLYKDKTLNLVPQTEMRVSKNYIHILELMPPKKAEALAYLDNNAAKPARQARAVLFLGEGTEPEVAEYIIGPLPNPTTVTLMKTRRKNPSPFAFRPITIPEFLYVFFVIMAEVDQKAGRLLRESFEATFTDCSDRCLSTYVSPVSSGVLGEIDRKIWIWANHKIEYHSLHPLSFVTLINLNGSDPTKYHIEKVLYNDVTYNSLDELMTAYDQMDNTMKVKTPFPTEDRNLFSTLNQRGVPSHLNRQRGPRQVEPDGKRYSIKSQSVQYLDWTFEYRMSTLTGPQLYDIKYRKERIVYELSLQEIAVYYSAHSPAQRAADFVDSVAQIGLRARGLVPGADCPDHATFAPATHMTEERSDPYTAQSAFCIFEHNTGKPLRRHLSYDRSEGHFYGGISDNVLILRTIMTIGNYDYVLDFIFHQNGAIDVEVMSTGYIAATYFTKNEAKYGFQLRPGINANIHHHMFHFKVDLDINGQSNRYETLDIETETVSNSQWYGGDYNQLKFVSDVKATERAAAYEYNFDTPKYHLIYNNAAKNQYKTNRAYRLLFNGMSKQLLPRNKGAETSVSWARYQHAVTKQKDSEFGSSSPYASWDGFDPVINFQDFIDDDESILDQDLVSWIAMGVHHIPHSEDLPITPTPGTRLSFSLLPYNYFDEDPSSQSLDSIRISMSKDGVEIDRSNTSENFQCVPQEHDFDNRVKETPSILFGP